jgi:hypothetical protein
MSDSATLGNRTPANEPLHRSPSEMRTWEIIAAYRFAHQLSSFHPNAQLARALANFLLKAQKELESRQSWHPDYLKSA